MRFHFVTILCSETGTHGVHKSLFAKRGKWRLVKVSGTEPSSLSSTIAHTSATFFFPRVLQGVFAELSNECPQHPAYFGVSDVLLPLRPCKVKIPHSRELSNSAWQQMVGTERCYNQWRSMQ